MTELRERLRTIVNEAVASGRTPGGAWCVLGPDGELARGAAGAACLEPAREPASESTPYDLASLTKPLATALAAALLERDGTLDLEAPVAALVPELSGTPFGGATLVELGSHRAGFPAWAPLFAAGNTRDAYLRAIAALAPAGESGRVLYSDPGYVVLGIAIERSCGLSLDVLFDRRVAAPLGLRSTGFAGTGNRFATAAATERGNRFERDMAGPAAGSYRFRTSVIRGHVHDANAWELGGVAGHAGLFGTAAEVARLGKAILDGLGGARMLTEAAPGAGRTFGLALARGTESLRDVLPGDAVGHFGFTGVSLWMEPAEGRVHVLLANRVHPSVPAEDFSATRRSFHGAASE